MCGIHDVVFSCWVLMTRRITVYDPSHSTSKAEVAYVNVECFGKDVSRPKVQILSKIMSNDVIFIKT